MDVEIIEDLLNINLIQGIYYDSASLEEQILSAQRQDCAAGIGGGMAARLSSKYSFNIIEVETSQTVIEATIDSAKSVAQAGRQEKEKALRYRCILDSASEGIITSDQSGNITTINQAARELLNVSEDDLQGKPIYRYISRAPIFDTMNHKKPIRDQVIRVNKERFVFSHNPIIMDKKVLGCVSTFNNISDVMRAENEVRRSLTRGLSAKYTFQDLIYQSPAMNNVVKRIKNIATSDSTILITGETGTGKEILSHSVHNLSHRKKRAFVSINCAALPETLLESELFGYEDGAFTGSRKGGNTGLFEMAHKGTILLDEIAATPHSVQIRLLRVLQEKEVMRIAGNSLIPIDVRVIANSNRDLVEEVQKGRIREDLFFRLNVLHIHIPPLRERVEDIPLLVAEFVEKISREQGLEPVIIPRANISKLMEYSWPGNVRQFINFIERIVLLCKSKFRHDIFQEQYNEIIRYSPILEKPAIDHPQTSLKKQLDQLNKENEVTIIVKALQQCKFKKGDAAALLGISRTKLWKRIKELNIQDYL